MSEGLLPIGTRIRFVETLDAPASGDHPALIYATKGEMGEITGYGTREGYWVKTDSWPNPFGASIEEFTPIKQLFVGCVLAGKGDTLTEVRPVAVAGYTMRQVREGLLRKVLEVMPPEEGWRNHNAVVGAASEEVIAAADYLKKGHKICVLTQGEYSSFGIAGLVSDKEDAEKWKARGQGSWGFDPQKGQVWRGTRQENWVDAADYEECVLDDPALIYQIRRIAAQQVTESGEPTGGVTLADSAEESDPRDGGDGSGSGSVNLE